MTWCSQIKNNITKPNIENNTNINKFIEQSIENQTACDRGYQREKTFISYAILDTGINNNGNTEYYLMVSGEWMYIDKRWNISSACGFGWIPTTIEIQQTQTGFIIINYQEALDGNKHLPSVKDMFSPIAFKKRQKNDFVYNTQLSPLQKAEKYFWITFWTWENFECTFCDQNRYESGYTLDSKDWTQEWYQIFGTQTNLEDRYIIFRNDGSFQNHNSRDAGTGTWIFWQNNTTILVDAEPHHTYDRYIIQHQTGDEIHLTREIIQK